MIDSERVAVESPDEQGARLIEELMLDVLSDLDVTQSLYNVKIYIDPDEPLFILYGKLAVSVPDIKISDVATTTHTDDGLKLDVKNERYVNDLIDKLVLLYGKANVLQLDRYTVLVATDEEIPDEIIFEPATELRRKVIDAIRRVAPEGYRIIRHEITRNSILFIASEEPIKEEWIALGHKLLRAAGG
ncbi:MAG TPA: methanogenesis marker 17 protein [Candidatus Bathyarchaeia archaeon]|jgi:putative methanogenesis marker protein 17|nr:methanogenesis marker 17 protein [Candidatus Bathyarchaeia archaeon]